MTKNSTLGDRMKFYEQRSDQTLLTTIPVMCRLDGRSFHNFCKGLRRPYDERLSGLMQSTTRFLVEETNARCGYTQSDEITLVWLAKGYDSELFFGGRLLKMVSVVGALATAHFNKLLASGIPEKRDQMPVFDSRVWNVPSKSEACNCFVWREMDATRNSITMAAQAYYSHKQLHKKSSAEKQEMLFQKGINWNDYPSFFKRGTYFRRRTVVTAFSPDELATLPPKHEAHTNPDLRTKRTMVVAEDFPPLKSLLNREGVVFDGEEPCVTSQQLEAVEKLRV